MADDTQKQLNEVFQVAKAQAVDAVLPLHHDALMDESLSSHTFYAWAEDISAGIPPKSRRNELMHPPHQTELSPCCCS